LEQLSKCWTEKELHHTPKLPLKALLDPNDIGEKAGGFGAGAEEIVLTGVDGAGWVSLASIFPISRA